NAPAMPSSPALTPSHGRSRSLAAHSTAPSVAPSTRAPSIISAAPTTNTRHTVHTVPPIDTMPGQLPTHYARSTRTATTAAPKEKKGFFKALGSGIGKAVKGVGFVGYFIVKLFYEMIKAILCACRPIPKTESEVGAKAAKKKDTKDDLKRRKKEAAEAAKRAQKEPKKSKDNKGKGKAVDLEAGG